MFGGCESSPLLPVFVLPLGRKTNLSHSRGITKYIGMHTMVSVLTDRISFTGKRYRGAESVPGRRGTGRAMATRIGKPGECAASVSCHGQGGFVSAGHLMLKA